MIAAVVLVNDNRDGAGGANNQEIINEETGESVRKWQKHALFISFTIIIIIIISGSEDDRTIALPLFRTRHHGAFIVYFDMGVSKARV